MLILLVVAALASSNEPPPLLENIDPSDDPAAAPDDEGDPATTEPPAEPTTEPTTVPPAEPAEPTPETPETTTQTTPETTVTPTPSTAKPRSDRRPAPEPTGLDDVSIWFIQMGVACVGFPLSLAAVAALASPLLYLGSAGLALTTVAMVLGVVIAGSGVGAAVGIVGDRFGRRRAGLVWPVIGGCLGVIPGGVGAGALCLVGLGACYNVAVGGFCGVRPEDAITSSAQVGGVALTVVAVSAVLPALFYAVDAEVKAPGDDGMTPQWWLPAPAPPTRTAVAGAIALDRMAF